MPAKLEAWAAVDPLLLEITEKSVQRGQNAVHESEMNRYASSPSEEPEQG